MGALARALGRDRDPRWSLHKRAAEAKVALVQALRAHRKASGLSQKQVAALLGGQQPRVSDFERLGGDPHLSTVLAYAVAVGYRGPLIQTMPEAVVHERKPRNLWAVPPAGGADASSFQPFGRHPVPEGDLALVRKGSA